MSVITTTGGGVIGYQGLRRGHFIDLTYGNASSESDVNGLSQHAGGVAAVALATGGMQFSVSGGAGSTDPDDGVVVAWRLRDLLGKDVSKFLPGTYMVLEVDTQPTGASGIVVAMGIQEGAAITTAVQHWAAIDWDHATQLQARAGTSGAATSAAATVSVAGTPGLVWDNYMQLITAGSFVTTQTSSILTNGTPAGNTTQTVARSVSSNIPDDSYCFVAVFASGAIAGTETIELRVGLAHHVGFPSDLIRL